MSIESRWPKNVVAGAKAAWATRQSNYLLVQMANPKVPTLKDWDDVPDDTKLWMCAEANAVIRSLTPDPPDRSLS